MKQLEALTGTGLKNDMDWYNARETIAPLLPSMINAQLGQRRNQTSLQGQLVQQRMPELRAQADANNRRLQEGSVINGTMLPGF